MIAIFSSLMTSPYFSTLQDPIPTDLTLLFAEFIDFSGAGDSDGPTFNGSDASTGWGGGYIPAPS